MINDLKDLKALLKLCRAQGITNIKLNGVEVVFGELPQQQSGMPTSQIYDEAPTSPYANFPQGELTEEQLIFYASGGKPDDDPLDKEAI